MIINQNMQQRTVYFQTNTLNRTFLDMHYFLKNKGINNNKFFLVLYDKDLMYINPRDPNLNSYMKSKVLRECMINYWYFIREVVRFPSSGATGEGTMYILNRGNLAASYCAGFNYNIFMELPRQQGKTVWAYTRLLWEFNYATTNSEFILFNKKHDDSKMNLARLKDIRDCLPSYLQMKDRWGTDGKKIKVKNSVETLEHVSNGNKITTVAAAKNKVAANSIARGKTSPRMWLDEYAFIPYNKTLYLAAMPAYKTAADNAKMHGAPYGIIITTTPGDRTTDEGEFAYQMTQLATQWHEGLYDLNPMQFNELMEKNENSSFIYIKYSYQQLGKSEEWFRQMVIDMQKDWAAIRREVLLIWETSSDNSPFTKEDLATVKNFIKEPINSVMLCTYYKMDIYEDFNPAYPPIIGVDVSGGFKRDSSAITIIDSITTRVCADFNCNYINTRDLARLIYELVTRYMPNAVVNVERNGGFGASVLSELIRSSIKKNLYYEIKDKVVEERINGSNIYKQTKKVKIYGLDSTKGVRDKLIDILMRRMEYHKDKFISPKIYSELETLEVKRNGRVEHTSTGHDDQIFSYLMALYVWYEGTDLMERFGIRKSSIKTDEETEEAYIPLEEKYSNIVEVLSVSDETIDSVKEQLEWLKDNTMTYEQWLSSQRKDDVKAYQQIASHPDGKKALLRRGKDISQLVSNRYTIPDDVFNKFYD